MIRLSSIINAYEADFLARYQQQLLPSHRKALETMKQCRSPQSPKMLLGCQACDHQHYMPHSCGHRSCPHCQSYESQQWIERQLKKQVPANYYLLTFTLPAEFRAMAWRHQQILYDLMIKCSWETLQTFSQNDKRLQGKPGVASVLHTHSRRLDYHPHVHIVMPAAAIDSKKRLWRTKQGQGKKPYLFSHKALAKVFRGKILDAIKRAGLVLPDRHPDTWVVDCKAVGSGEKALTYLGRYLYRGVIREKDIVANRDGQVTFRYTESKSKKTKLRTLPGATFLWLLMQHVLPKGFRRVRNFGFLHPNSKRLIQLLHYLLNISPPAVLTVTKRPAVICQCCGAAMKIIRTRIYPTLKGRLKARVAPLVM